MLATIKKWFSNKGTCNRVVADEYKKKGNEALSVGDLTAAQSFYEQYIHSAPQDAEGYINLAFVCLERGDHLKALSLVEHAISLNNKNADAFFILGAARQRQGEFINAAQAYKAAIDVNPDMQIAYQCLYDIYFNNPQYHELKTTILIGANDYPNQPLAQFYAGQACLVDDASLDMAIEYFNNVLRIEPNNALVYFQLGVIYQKQHKLDDAIFFYRAAIFRDNRMLDAHVNLAAALQLQDKLAEALSVCENGLESYPQCAELHNTVGVILYQKNQFSEAVVSLKKAIDISPDYIDAHNNIAEAYARLDYVNKTIEHYKKVLFLGRESADILNALAHALEKKGDITEAVNQYRRALVLSSDEKTINKIRSNILYTLSFYSDHYLPEYIEEAKSYGEWLTSHAVAFEYTNRQCTHHKNKLRVGLVSGDFYQHPVGYFLDNVISHIDSSKIEIVVYDNKSKLDSLTQQLKSCCSSWVDISKMNNQLAATRIYDDQIDILIDLAGHTATNRLPIFAWKPAPLQITWLGYWASTGVTEIDYLLADEASLPMCYQDQFTENICYLPQTRMCFSPATDAPAISILPATHNGFITFGSFQPLTKLNDQVLRLWAQVLMNVPNSQLRLQARQFNDERMKTDFGDRLKKAGIELDRVQLVGGMSYPDYLNAYAEVDIILDTFPFSGGTTTCEALWMGVPTLTLVGQTMIARQGASFLHGVGLHEWVAENKQQFVDLAVKHASHLPQLAETRNTLRRQISDTSLFNGALFARQFESALRHMWSHKMQNIAVKT